MLFRSGLVKNSLIITNTNYYLHYTYDCSANYILVSEYSKYFKVFAYFLIISLILIIIIWYLIKNKNESNEFKLIL